MYSPTMSYPNYPPSLEAKQLHVATVKDAVHTLCQTVQLCDLEEDDTLTSSLAKAAQTVSDFLKLAASTVSTEENYGMLPLWMRGELVQCLDLILCERFLQTLFKLRQTIRSMAIKREHVVSSQMATLPDVVIAAIIDYVSAEDVLNVETARGVKAYPTIELTVRLPHRMDSLAHFLANPIPEIDKHLGLQAKLKALALLYCSHCLNPSSNKTSQDNVVDYLSGFWLYIDIEKLPHPSIIHMLCVYMYSYSTCRDELHPFRPATNSILWALLLKIFPESRFLYELNHSQRMLFSHGDVVMPWIWKNSALCPAEETDWAGRITLMWLHQKYLVFRSRFIDYEKASFDDIFHHFHRFTLKTSSFTNMKETLLGNDRKGFKILLNIKKHERFAKSYNGIEKFFSGYIVLLILQIYSDLCDSEELVSIPLEYDEICGEIRRILQSEIEWTLEEQAPPHGLEILAFTLKISKNKFAQILESLKLNLGRLLEGILVTIEMYADPSRSKEQCFGDQVTALIKLKFLAKWVEIRSSENLLVIPLTSLNNLVNMLLKPLRCGDQIALAMTELIFSISKSGSDKWGLNCKQLQIISDAINEVMGAEDERCRIEAGLLAAKFVKEFSTRFDYSTNYPMNIFWNLREQLSHMLWNHWFTLDKNEDDGLRKTPVNDRFELNETRNAISVVLLGEALYTLFNQLRGVQKKYIQASPLTMDLIIDIRSTVWENDDMIKKLIEILSATR